MGSRLHAIDAVGIERVVEDYRAAATRAVDAGFDSIEVHVGHNYLLSAFLSPKLNKRKDQFGGSVENRARFARNVLRNVRDAVGDKAAVTAKLNMADGVDGGLWVDESVQVASLFEADGTLDALELTGGSSLANPMYLFRGDAPLREFGATLPPPVRVGFKIIGNRFLKTYPYEEAFFLPFARQFRAALNRTCPTACRRAPRRRRCASIATSACRRSTRARAASWWPTAPARPDPDAAASRRPVQPLTAS
jgi:2,4-dienoyl-CoA reductase-like NADH-dependent reductase (Old Yellow Enzyme family)